MIANRDGNLTAHQNIRLVATQSDQVRLGQQLGITILDQQIQLGVDRGKSAQIAESVRRFRIDLALAGIKDPRRRRARTAVVFQPQFLRLRAVDLDDFRFDPNLDRFGDFQQIHHFFAVGPGDFFGPGPLVLIVDRPFKDDSLVDFGHPNVGIAENAFDLAGNRRVGGRYLHQIVLTAGAGPDDQGGGPGLLPYQNQFRAGNDYDIGHIRIGDRRPLQPVHRYRP